MFLLVPPTPELQAYDRRNRRERIVQDHYLVVFMNFQQRRLTIPAQRQPRQSPHKAETRLCSIPLRYSKSWALLIFRIDSVSRPNIATCEKRPVHDIRITEIGPGAGRQPRVLLMHVITKPRVLKSATDAFKGTDLVSTIFLCRSFEPFDQALLQGPRGGVMRVQAVSCTIAHRLGKYTPCGCIASIHNFDPRHGRA